ncbi:MAG: hypothetical protein ABIF01_04595 [Candidatus Micrarchaeota archaeon]
MGRPNQWRISPAILKTHVYQVCQQYPQLTLRGLFYRLLVFGYPNELGFYKFLSRRVKRWRLEDPELNQKFIDVGRLPFLPKPPSIEKVEAWFEKASAYVTLRDIIERFRIPVQIQKGYGSLSMYSRAIRRAHKRDVEVVAYWGDVGPSGFDIQRVTRKTMIPVKVRRIALTWEQVRRYRLPPRPAKPKDRRTPRYIKRWGTTDTYEIEALDPRILRRITERRLRKLIPPEHLRELEMRERAAKVTVELLRPLRERVEKMVRELLERGLSLEEIRRRFGGRIGF